MFDLQVVIDKFIVNKNFSEENGLVICVIETTCGKEFRGHGNSNDDAELLAIQRLVESSVVESLNPKLKNVKMFDGKPLSTYYKEIHFLNLGVGCGFNIEEAHPLGRTTLCCLVTNNGFTVVGQSVASSYGHFKESLGRDYAKEDAENKLIDYLVFADKMKSVSEKAVENSEHALDISSSELFKRLLSLTIHKTEAGIFYSFEMYNMAGIVESTTGPCRETPEEAQAAAIDMFLKQATEVYRQEEYMKKMAR